MANTSKSGWGVSGDTSGWDDSGDEGEECKVKTMNRYDKLRDDDDGDWCESDGRGRETFNESGDELEFQTQRRKRKKRLTGSVDSHTFSAMSTDDKLDMIFNKLVQIESKQSSIEKLETMMKRSNETMSTLQTKSNTQDDMLNILNYRSTDLEARSRRKNLIFRGLFEFRNENCVDVMYQFLYNQLNLDAESVVIERAHRLGRWDPNRRKRPMIVLFREYQSVEKIVDKAWMLGDTPYRIDRDYPREIVDARKLLRNRYRQLKDDGVKVQMVYPAKLVVGRKVVEDAFPGWQEALKGARIEPFESDTVRMCNLAANNRSNKRQDSTSDNHTTEAPRNRTALQNPNRDNARRRSDSTTNRKQQRDFSNQGLFNLDSQKWRLMIDDQKQMGHNTETQRQASRSKTDPIRAKPSGKGRGPNPINNKSQGQSEAKDIPSSNTSNNENQNRNNGKEPKNLERDKNNEPQNTLRKSSNDTVLSMEADDSVDENDHVFYSQYVSRMGTNNQSWTSDTGAGQPYIDNMKLINYAPMAQFPPLPNRELTPITAATEKKTGGDVREKSVGTSTNEQSVANDKRNDQGQNGQGGDETRKKDEQSTKYPV